MIRTGKRAKKSSAGYDLTRLLVGSEGTLGIITAITLKLYGIPQAIAGGVCPFPSVEAACTAVIATIQMGIPVARIELVNALQMRAMIAYSKLDYPETPCLFVEFHGSEAGVAEQSASFGEIVAEFGGGPFLSTTQCRGADKAVEGKARRLLGLDGAEARRQGLSTDVCVPISRLAECIAATEADIAEHGMTAPIVGHVGDGNFHVLVLMDRDDPAEDRGDGGFRRDGSTCAPSRWTAPAPASTASARARSPSWSTSIGAGADFMRTIKRALDPLDILNPGKILPAASAD